MPRRAPTNTRTSCRPARRRAAGPRRSRASKAPRALVTDTRVGGFIVLPNMPALRVTKTVDVLSDPVNGAVNPRQIPGSLQRYRVTVANTGVRVGRCEHARHCRLRAAQRRARRRRRPCRAVLRWYGTERLDVQLRVAREFSNQPGGAPPYSYVPAANGNGVDPTSPRCVSPRAARCPARLSGNEPSFSVEFRVRVR